MNNNALIHKLPYEIWTLIFENLDIPDVKTCEKLCTLFYLLATDSYLIHRRLSRTASWLDYEFDKRPTNFDLFKRRILLSPYQLSPECKPSHLQLIMTVSFQIKKDAVERGLQSRPSKKQLKERGVIVDSSSIIAPKIKSLERQRVADKIAQFLENRPTLETAIQKGYVQQVPDQKTPVQTLTRMFTYWISQNRVDSTSSTIAPPRANVYKMRKQFESKSATATATATTTSQAPLRKQCTGTQFGAVASLRQHFIQLSV